MTADYILQETYGEVDLKEDPIIVPSCGHLMTRSSMDGHMAMADYYDLAADDGYTVRSLKPLPAPFSKENIKKCPICRGPLRNINRYNRIVRQGLLEEATKKFITWANREYLPLQESLDREEQQLQESGEAFSGRFREDEEPVAVSGSSAHDEIRLDKSPSHQIETIRRLRPLDARYRSIVAVRREISKFLKQVSEEEQPFGRVFDMLQDLRRKQGNLEIKMSVDRDILNTRNRMLVSVLSIRCDLAIVSDFMTIFRQRQKQGRSRQQPFSVKLHLPSWMQAALHVDFSRNRQVCTSLITEALAREQPRVEVEARIFLARWCSLERSSPSLSSMVSSSPQLDNKQTLLLEEAQEQLSLAKSICKRYPGQTRGMLSEIEAVEEMIKHDAAVFYSPVSNEEKRQVYAAMALEFSGTGHWYTCENGHPFTIANCGMPMQTSVCPQCGAPVGGENHQTAPGVRHARDFEEQFGGLRLE